MDLAPSWTAPPALRTVQAATDGNLDLAIPQSATYAESPISVGPGVDFVEYVEVEAVVRHSAFRDVDIELVSPSGVVSSLAEYGASRPRSAAGRGPARDGAAPGRGPVGHVDAAGPGQRGGQRRRPPPWSLTIYGHGRPTDLPVITGVNSASTALTVTWTIDDAAA